MDLKTPEEIKHELAIRGLTVTEWARYTGYTPGLVYQVLAGRVLCKRGKSHEIAVKLGLKKGVLGEISDLTFTESEEVLVDVENNQR